MDHPEEPFQVDDFSSIARQIQHPITQPIHEEDLRQTKYGFNAALTLGVLGTLLLFAAVAVFAYRGFGPGSGISVAAGVILDVLSFFMIKFLREAATRLDQIRRDENAMYLAGQITDDNKRDEAICQLIKTLGK